MSNDLPDAITAMYAVFSSYDAGAPADYCSYCHSVDRLERWRTTSLRDLDPDELRPLLWEASDHLSTAAYKHFLPRLFEIMAPPLSADPLYPAHPFEVLAQHGFATWPAPEQQAVRRAVLAIEAALRAGEDPWDDSPDGRANDWQKGLELLGGSAP